MALARATRAYAGLGRQRDDRARLDLAVVEQIGIVHLTVDGHTLADLDALLTFSIERVVGQPVCIDVILVNTSVERDVLPVDISYLTCERNPFVVLQIVMDDRGVTRFLLVRGAREEMLVARAALPSEHPYKTSSDQ